MMLLFDAAGVRPEIPQDAEAQEAIRLALTRTAEAFIRAGGILTLADWAQLDGGERAAFVAAGDRIAAERAASTGYAAQGMRAAAAVMSPADGGESHRRVVVQEAAAKAELEPATLAAGDNGA